MIILVRAAVLVSPVRGPHQMLRDRSWLRLHPPGAVQLTHLGDERGASR